MPEITASYGKTDVLRGKTRAQTAQNSGNPTHGFSHAPKDPAENQDSENAPPTHKRNLREKTQQNATPDRQKPLRNATGADPWPLDLKCAVNISRSRVSTRDRVPLQKWEQHFAATRVCLPRQARQERLAFQTNHKVSGFAQHLARTPDS